MTMKNRRSGILPLGCFLQAAGRRFNNDNSLPGLNDSGEPGAGDAPIKNAFLVRIHRLLYKRSLQWKLSQQDV